MPCSPDYVAAALIVGLGSVIGARCAIKPKRRDDWIVTPNLFGGVVGDPSLEEDAGHQRARCDSWIAWRPRKPSDTPSG